MRIPVEFVGGAYESASLPISAQEAVNCYVEIGQDAANPVSLRGVPGAEQVGTLTDIRGLAEVFGSLYAVAGTKAYKVNSDGTHVVLGTVPNDGEPACITQNIFEAIIISGQEGYTAKGNVFTLIEGFPAATHCGFLDGYVLTTEAGSGRFRWTGINDSTVNGANFATAEGFPDDTVGMVIDHREIFLFGKRSLERFFNDGVAPFARAPGGFSERGCGAGYSPAKVDNTVFWLGDDFIVYRLTEGRPTRVSNHGVEELIKRTNAPSKAIGLTYSEAGHAFYQLTIPGELTVTFDASTQLWHTRKLYGRKDCGYYHHAEAYGNQYVGGQKLWKFNAGFEFSGPLERIRAIGPIKTGQRFNRMYSLVLIFETGSKADYIDAATLFLEISDDGGRTFSDRAESSIGSKGMYTQEVTFHGLGGFYDNERVIRLTLTDAARFSLVQAYAEVG